MMLLELRAWRSHGRHPCKATISRGWRCAKVREPVPAAMPSLTTPAKPPRIPWPAPPTADGMQLQPAALRPMFDQLGVQIDSSLLIELREEECSLAGGFVATVRLVGRRAPGREGGRCRCPAAEAGQLLSPAVSVTAARLFSVGPLPDLT